MKRRSALFRLPAPIFLIVCIVWLAWSIVSLLCKVLIWILLRVIGASEHASRGLHLHRRPERRVSVCVTTPTVTPERAPVITVPLPRHDPDMSNLVEQGGRSAHCADNAEREDKIKRLMLALGLKHREFAEDVVDKGYPVGW